MLIKAWMLSQKIAFWPWLQNTLDHNHLVFLKMHANFSHFFLVYLQCMEVRDSVISGKVSQVKWLRLQLDWISETRRLIVVSMQVKELGLRKIDLCRHICEFSIACIASCPSRRWWLNNAAVQTRSRRSLIFIWLYSSFGFLWIEIRNKNLVEYSFWCFQLLYVRLGHIVVWTFGFTIGKRNDAQRQPGRIRSIYIRMLMCLL